MNRPTNPAASAVHCAGPVDALHDARGTDSLPLAGEHRGALDNYRFEHFDFRMMLQDMRFSQESLRAGDRLPDTTLLTPDGDEASLRELAAGRPIVLVTGSTSCPLTVSSLPDLNRLEKRYGDRVQFVLLQVREAHPGAELNQPHTQQEKLEHAQHMREVLGVRWPVLVDDIDGSLHRLLDTQPNSLHIIAPGGEILYRALAAGDAGVEDAIARVAAGDPPRKEQSQSMLPMLESAGFMHDTLVRAGKGAYVDVAKSAPPMVALAMGAKLMPFIPKRKRGYALMLTFAALVVAVTQVF